MRSPLALLIGLLTAATLGAQEPPPPLATPSVPEPGQTKPAAQQFKELVPALVDALKDIDPDVRQHAALALAAVGSVAVKPLTEALKDGSRERRAAAAYAIGQMGYVGRDAVPELVKLLKDEDPNVRRAAAQAISRIVSSEGLRMSNPPRAGVPALQIQLPVPARGIFPAGPEDPRPDPVPRIEIPK
ncbi:MAG: HEAT repeat domain-containing protein [Gemmataceae bacterium]